MGQAHRLESRHRAGGPKRNGIQKFVYDPLPDDLRKHVVNLDDFWNVDEACSFYARAHTVICHEPHTPIMALAAGTPMMHTFSEFHSPKCWMFKDIGLEEWAPEFDSTPAESPDFPRVEPRGPRRAARWGGNREPIPDRPVSRRYEHVENALAVIAGVGVHSAFDVLGVLPHVGL